MKALAIYLATFLSFSFALRNSREGLFHLDVENKVSLPAGEQVEGQAVYNLEFDVTLNQTWPAGVFGIDIDIVDKRSRFISSVPEYFSFPAQRVSLTYEIPPLLPNSIPDNRPTVDQAAKSCDVLAELLPWMHIRPCRPSSVFDLNVGRGALIAPHAISRSGRLGETIFDSSEMLKYTSYSSATQYTNFVPFDSLTWGSGLVDLSAANGTQLFSIAAVSSEVYSVEGPLHFANDGLFFPSQSAEVLTHAKVDTFSGQIAEVVRSRFHAFQKAGFTTSYWKPLSLHISIVPVSSTTVRVALVETAVHTEVGVEFPTLMTLEESASSDSHIAISTIVMSDDNSCKKRLLINPGVFSFDELEIPMSSTMNRLFLSDFCSDKSNSRSDLSVPAIRRWFWSGTKPSNVAHFLHFSRSEASTGLHRETSWEFHSSKSAIAPSDDSSSFLEVSRKPGVSCHAVMSQWIPETLYFDLDETREQQRGGPLELYEGSSFRAFSKFIDVERPSPVSSQHLVLFRHPLVISVSQNSSRITGRPYGGAFYESLDSVLSIVFKQLLHSRYQLPGCADARGDQELDVRGLNGSSLSLHSARLTFGNPFGFELAADGSFFFQADVFQNSSNDAKAKNAPIFSGCYAFTYLPDPSMTIECTVPSLSGGETPDSHDQRYSFLAFVEPSHLNEEHTHDLLPPTPTGERAVHTPVFLLTTLATIAGAFAICFASYSDFARRALSEHKTRSGIIYNPGATVTATEILPGRLPLQSAISPDFHFALDSAVSSGNVLVQQEFFPPNSGRVITTSESKDESSKSSSSNASGEESDALELDRIAARFDNKHELEEAVRRGDDLFGTSATQNTPKKNTSSTFVEEKSTPRATLMVDADDEEKREEPRKRAVLNRRKSVTTATSARTGRSQTPSKVTSTPSNTRKVRAVSRSARK